jgi:hypothetical protein
MITLQIETEYFHSACIIIFFWFLLSLFGFVGALFKMRKGEEIHPIMMEVQQKYEQNPGANMKKENNSDSGSSKKRF